MDRRTQGSVLPPLRWSANGRVHPTLELGEQLQDLGTAKGRSWVMMMPVTRLLGSSQK